MQTLCTSNSSRPLQLGKATPSYMAPAPAADGGRRPATSTGQLVLRGDANRGDIKINTKQLVSQSRAEQTASGAGQLYITGN